MSDNWWDDSFRYQQMLQNQGQFNSGLAQQANALNRAPATIQEVIDAHITRAKAEVDSLEALRRQLSEAGMLGAPYAMLRALQRL